MDNKHSDLTKNGSENRRNFLRTGLMLTSGLTFGFSIIKEAWGKEITPRKARMQSPADRKTVSPRKFTVSRAKRFELSRRIMPALKDMLENAGLKISAQEMSELQQAFAERGTITIPKGETSGGIITHLDGMVTFIGRS